MVSFRSFFDQFVTDKRRKELFPCIFRVAQLSLVDFVPFVSGFSRIFIYYYLFRWVFALCVSVRKSFSFRGPSVIKWLCLEGTIKLSFHPAITNSCEQGDN